MKKKWFGAIFLTSLWLLTSGALHSQEEPSGQIAFVTDRDGNQEIYKMDADGSNLVNLTANPAEDSNPAWSPDGSQLAFVSDRSGSSQIYVMKADGSEVRQITDIEPKGDSVLPFGNLVWSPDGERIAYSSEYLTPIDTGQQFKLEIYWLEVDSGNTHRVYAETGYGGRITWSPNSQRLLFHNNVDGDFELFIANLDGSGLHTVASGVHSGGPLSGEASWEVEPAWSPGGGRIAFGSDRLEGRLDVYVANQDGSNIRNLTQDINYAFGPVWSPDGRYIAFMSFGEGLYIANANNGELLKLSELSHQGVGSEWTWSPEADRVAFSTGKGDDYDIYIVSTDGSGLTNLTNYSGRDTSPTWQPVTSHSPEKGLIAFLGTDNIGNETTVWIIQADGSGLRELPLDHISPAEYRPTCWPRPKFSADGRYLAVMRQRRIAEGVSPRVVSELVAIDVLTEQIVVVSDEATSFDWAPEGHRLVVSLSGDYTVDNTVDKYGLWIADVDSGELNLAFIPVVGQLLTDPQWSPDGQRIAFYDMTPWQDLTFGTAHLDGTDYSLWDYHVGNYDWSPDSQKILFDTDFMDSPSFDNTLNLANADGTSVTTILNSEAFGPSDPSWSPDGQLIAFTNYAQYDEVSTLWVVNPDGTNPRQLTDNTEWASWWSAWSPDSSQLVASGDIEVQVISLDGSAPLFLDRGTCPAWQPSAAEPPDFTITGSVIDAVTGRPMVDVYISIGDGQTVKTDQGGSYRFEDLPIGTYTLTASRDGYLFSPSQHQVVLPSSVPSWDFTGRRVSSDEELTRRFMPLLHFHYAETYDVPISVTSVLPYSDLVNKELNPPRTEIANLLDNQWNVKGTYIDFLGEGRIDLEEKYGEVICPDDCQPVIYARVFPNERQGSAIVVQYWLFYYGNGHGFAGLNFHEGDWEMIQVILDANETPRYAAYSQHKSGSKRLWSNVDKGYWNGAEHPKVYVANGSHASYFKPGLYIGTDVGVDDAGDKPLESIPRLIIIPGDQNWPEFKGHWGDEGPSELITDDDGPLGPIYQESKWENPLTWARTETCWDEDCRFNISGKLRVSVASPLDVTLSIMTEQVRSSGKPIAKRSAQTDWTPSMPKNAEYFDNPFTKRRTILLDEIDPGADYEVGIFYRAPENQADPGDTTVPLNLIINYPDIAAGKMITAEYNMENLWNSQTTGYITVSSGRDLVLSLDMDGDGQEDEEVGPISIDETAADFLPPDAVDDLRAIADKPGTVTLSWTAPGDDDAIGTAAAYDIRYYDEPITVTNWLSATQVTNVSLPAPGGTAETLTLTDLEPGRYYFASLAFDEVMLFSTLSNSAEAQVLPSLQVSFTARPTNGEVPLTVEFVNETLGEQETFIWDFGDGRGSNEESPEHTYMAAGAYTVTLAVSGSAGQDIYTRAKFVIVQEPKGTTGEGTNNDTLIAWLQDNGLLLIAAITVAGLVLVSILGTVLWRRRRQVDAVRPSVDNRFCIHCGEEYLPTAQFCAKCGRERE